MKAPNLDERIERLAELKRKREDIEREIMGLFATAPVHNEPARRGRPRKGSSGSEPIEEQATADTLAGRG